MRQSVEAGHKMAIGVAIFLALAVCATATVGNQGNQGNMGNMGGDKNKMGGMKGDMGGDMGGDMDGMGHSHKHKKQEMPKGPSVVLAWNDLLLHQFRCGLGAKNAGCDTTHGYLKLGPPMTSRALAIMHTCMYDTWAHYDETAVALTWDQSSPFGRVPVEGRSLANKTEAVSCAAYLALTRIFQTGSAKQLAEFDAAYAMFTEKPVPEACLHGSGVSDDPDVIAYNACQRVLARHANDNSNQNGNYADTTNFHPVNGPLDVNLPTYDFSQLKDPNMWQPLILTTGGQPQSFMSPQWWSVTPFAICHDQYRPPLDTLIRYGENGYMQQAVELLKISAGLTDAQKMKAEYWADGPESETPPGHWNVFAQAIAYRDMNSLDDDVKLFFALNNALSDAAISCWDGKIAYQYIRPISAIRSLFSGKDIMAWSNGQTGPQKMKGDQWKPYQLDVALTPAFPSYTSGHSTFSAAGAEILASFTESDEFDYGVTLKAGSSVVEPGLTPKHDVMLHWATFSEAADQAGISRRYGGIHFKNDDLAGRSIGRLIGAQAWAYAMSLFRGEPFYIPSCEPVANKVIINL